MILSLGGGRDGGEYLIRTNLRHMEAKMTNALYSERIRIGRCNLVDLSSIYVRVTTPRISAIGYAMDRQNMFSGKS